MWMLWSFILTYIFFIPTPKIVKLQNMFFTVYTIDKVIETWEYDIFKFILLQVYQNIRNSKTQNLQTTSDA